MVKGKRPGERKSDQRRKVQDSGHAIMLDCSYIHYGCRRGQFNCSIAQIAVFSRLGGGDKKCKKGLATTHAPINVSWVIMGAEELEFF